MKLFALSLYNASSWLYMRLTKTDTTHLCVNSSSIKLFHVPTTEAVGTDMRDISTDVMMIDVDNKMAK